MKKKRIDEEWNRESQSVWNCTMAGLKGLKSCSWLTSKEYTHIVDKLEEFVENK